MATIKSYTDIHQSKKLAKILPLESADMMYMYWIKSTPEGIKQEGIDGIPTIKEELPIDSCDIPCWSLAALLNVLPKNLNIGRPSLESNYNGYYWIQYYDEFMKPNNYKTECFNNPVDACINIIIKFNELKKL